VTGEVRERADMQGFEHLLVRRLLPLEDQGRGEMRPYGVDFSGSSLRAKPFWSTFVIQPEC
jgi:hypothetical protein